MNLVTFLVLLSLSYLGKGTHHLKSFKLNEKIIYNCIDIYKQPSLNHSLLKNHTIQLKPTGSISKSRNQVRNKGYKKNVECEEGTVPILIKTTQEDVLNAQKLANNHFNPLANGTSIHRVGVKTGDNGTYHGFRADMSVYTVKNVSIDQVSSAQAYVANGSNGIQIGWMVNPSLYGDSRVWSYGSWQGKNGSGCLNLQCPGFVQVAKDYPLSEPMMISNQTDLLLQIHLHQDNETGHWWLTQKIPEADDVDIGYWPKELFDTMADGAKVVGYEGSVQTSPSGSSPPMGDGRLPTDNIKDSAFFMQLRVINSTYDLDLADKYNLQEVIDNTKCYGLKYIGFHFGNNVSVNFGYGGPGGQSC